MRTFLKEIAGTARFVAVLAAVYLGFSTLAFAQYYIPSESMRPTLEVGDRLLVNKFAYGWSRHSLPRLLAERVPERGGERLFGRAPARGDVIVFRRPDQPLILIKRVVALPGETVAVRDGQLIIDDAPVALRPEGRARLVSHLGDVEAARYREQLPAAAEHPVYDLIADGRLDDFGPQLVAEDCYFVMGDNRDDSLDSRVWGCVPAANIVGRAEVIGWTLAWLRADPHEARDRNRLWRGL